VQERPDIAIVGPGKVGRTLGVLATRAGWHVAAVAGRTPEQSQAAAAVIGHGARAATASEAAGAGGLVLLTVQDAHIAPLCEQLAEAGALGRGTIVAHCSGALSSEVLAPARDACGCRVGSMHPLQTFPTVEAAEAELPGAYCFIEGDEPATAVLAELAESIGCTAVHIAPAGKVLYHAAAVMACNYLATLLDAAAELAERGGVPRQTHRAAIEPLVRATLANVFSMGPAAALTGPVARGDVETVARHLAAIDRPGDSLGDLYRAAGKRTVDLATEKGTIDRATADALRKLLDRKPTKE